MSHKKTSTDISGCLAVKDPLEATRSLMALIRSGQSPTDWLEKESRRIRGTLPSWTPPGVRPQKDTHESH